MRSAAKPLRRVSANTEAPDNADDGTAAIVLTLVDLDQSITKLTAALGRNVTVECVLTNLLDNCICITPDRMAEDSVIENDQQARDAIYKSIMRYRKESDRWTALASVLLKSMAFHRSARLSKCVADERDDQWVLDLLLKGFNSEKKLETFPLVNLPRTKYNRPYIPRLTTPERQGSINKSKADDTEGENENQFEQINVSHQYPHIAIVQSMGSRLKLGMDIVVFQFHKNEFTPTTNDFLQSFQASFSSWEWERIQYCSGGGLFRSRVQRTNEAKLREFFLRWAMKEAYTKALGLGMNVEFSSFETRLFGIDDISGKDESIWNAITSTPNGTSESNVSKEFSTESLEQNFTLPQYPVCGRVHHFISKTDSHPAISVDLDNMWEFIFVPIATRHEYSRHGACCCICREVSPQNGIKLPIDLEEVGRSSVAIECVDLLDMINWHKC